MKCQPISVTCTDTSDNICVKTCTNTPLIRTFIIKTTEYGTVYAEPILMHKFRLQYASVHRCPRGSYMRLHDDPVLKLFYWLYSV